MRPRITTLYIDVVTLRRCDEASQTAKMSRSEYIRRAIREKLDRDDGLVDTDTESDIDARPIVGRTGAFRRIS